MDGSDLKKMRNERHGNLSFDMLTPLLDIKVPLTTMYNHFVSHAFLFIDEALQSTYNMTREFQRVMI